jgi:hypothetical protein
VAQALLNEGLKHTPLAVLSRPVVGTRNATLICTLPGRYSLAHLTLPVHHACAVSDHPPTATVLLQREGGAREHRVSEGPAAQDYGADQGRRREHTAAAQHQVEMLHNSLTLMGARRFDDQDWRR